LCLLARRRFFSLCFRIFLRRFLIKLPIEHLSELDARPGGTVRPGHTRISDWSNKGYPAGV
jgi:hypothetical protein